MATIVKLNQSDEHAVLVGVGFGMFMAQRPSAIFGSWAPTEQRGDAAMAAVSTASGEIRWCKTEDLTVVSVDGKPPKAHLRKLND